MFFCHAHGVPSQDLFGDSFADSKRREPVDRESRLQKQCMAIRF